ncbi:transmembrane protein 151B-like [Acanthaster planci]|uniref:Transmembrane protein 151B-like n=1 Tax=Acanthaster planci TaxID=133434 RepID=A0A8B7YL52_ACAPL|nr:transmembrane protein 151B-like [Acanthaster planci]
MTNNEQTASSPLEQRPIQRSFCTTLRDETHWKCLILSLLMYGSLTVILWCELTTVEVVAYTYRGSPVPMHDSPCEDGYMYIPVAFLVLLYLVYLLECWYSEIRIEIFYKEDTRTVYDRIRRIRESFPVVWWRAISYHYNRHTRQVTRYRHGDTYTTTQEYFERINTHSAASAFDFTECGVKDVSKHLIDLEEFPITRVSFSKNFMFLNEESEYDYLSQRARFFGENDGRDENMETREGLTLTDVEFTDDMISYAYTPDKLPWYYSMSVFWAMSFIMLSWPYRLIVSYKTAVVDYQIEKLFGTNYSTGMLSMEHWNGETMHLTRVSNVGSNCSLESMIRGNRHVVPSYSEAVLMDLANGNVPRAGQTPNGNTPLAASRTRSVGGSDGFLANGVHGAVTNNSGSRRSNVRRLFSFANAKRSATAPLHGSGVLSGRSSPSLRAIGASAHLLITKDRLKGASNGHASPISIQLTPTINGIGGIHLSGTSITPKTQIPNVKAEQMNRAAASAVSPRQETSFAAKAATTSSSTEVQTNNTKKRPTSLPLCVSNAETVIENCVNQQCLPSWVVVDEHQGVRTVIQQPQATQAPTENHLVSHHQPAMPEDPPPAYEVALEMEVPPMSADHERPVEPENQPQQSRINMETSL